jgi:hypothetical protein
LNEIGSTQKAAAKRLKLPLSQIKNYIKGERSQQNRIPLRKGKKMAFANYNERIVKMIKEYILNSKTPL